MTVYTDSLANLKKYRTDFYKIAVATNLPYQIQNKIDAWFNDLAPSRTLFDMFEQEKIDWNEFIILYGKEMSTVVAKSKIKWVRYFSKNNDVVLLCHENESDPKCHRYELKRLIEGDV